MAKDKLTPKVRVSRKTMAAVLVGGARMLAAIILAAIVLTYSFGASFLWRKSSPPHRNDTCDNSSESVDQNSLVNAYVSPRFKSQLNSALNNPQTAVRLQTSDPAIGALNEISLGDPTVTSQTSNEDNATVYTSTKTAGSQNPLGWEADLTETYSGHTDDYAIKLTYKSSVVVEIGATYRKDGETTSSIVFTKLPASIDWNEQILHFSTYPPDTHPYFTISSMQTGTISVKDVKIGLLPYRQLSSGLVSIAFDDGWQSVYMYGLPLFVKYGVSTTQYIVSDFSLNKNPQSGYMTTRQVKKLQEAGSEVGSHSFEHCNATQQNDNELKNSVQKSQDQFKKALNKTPQLYAHPFGAYDNRVNNILGSYYTYIRSSDVGINTAYFDPDNIRIVPVLDATSTSDIQQYVKSAAEQHVWIILLYHRINEAGDYSITSAQLEAQLKAITSQTGIKIMPVGQALQTMKSLR